MSQGESLADALATINRLKLSHMEVSDRLNLSGKFGACVDLNLHLCGGLSLVAFIRTDYWREGLLCSSRASETKCTLITEASHRFRVQTFRARFVN